MSERRKSIGNPKIVQIDVEKAKQAAEIQGWSSEMGNFANPDDWKAKNMQEQATENQG